MNCKSQVVRGIPRSPFFYVFGAIALWVPAGSHGADVSGGDPVYRVPGEIMVFDGSTNHEDIPFEPQMALPAESGQITVAAWVRPGDLGRSQILFKREGAFQLGIGGWNQKRAFFAVWSPKLHTLMTNPVLEPGRWYHMAGTYDGKKATFYLDGGAVVSESAPGELATGKNRPLWIGANLIPPDNTPTMQFKGELVGMALWDRALGEEQIASLAAKPPVGVTLSPKNPATKGQATTAVKPPSSSPAAVPLVGSLGGVALAFDVGAGIRLRHIGGKAVSAGGRLFALRVGDRNIQSDEVSVRQEEVVAAPEGWAIPFDLPDGLGIGTLRLSAGEEPGVIAARLELANGGPASVWRVLFPLIEGVTLDGGGSENLEFFFPFQEGWLGKGEGALSIMYGTRAWLPVLAAWHPGGAGISLQVRDADFAPFSLLFRNAATGGAGTGRLADNMEPDEAMKSLHGGAYHPDHGRAAEAFPLKAPGLTMGMATLEFPLGITQTWTSRTYAIHVYDGNGLFKTPLATYGKWARANWWKHRPMDPSIRDMFLAFAVLERVGNRGFERGFLDEEKYIIADQAEAYASGMGGHPFPEITGWWNLGNEIKTGRYAGRFYPHTAGDYAFEPRFGGVEALGAEIRRVQALGGRVSLYTMARTVWKNSKVGLAHGKEWALMDKPGHYNRDWSENGEGEWKTDYWNLCPQVKGWQEHMREVARRALAESGADALRLDTAAESLICYNPHHEHARNPLVGLIEFLATVREGVVAAGPHKTLWAEFCGSDAAAMYLDGSLSQGSAPGTPMVDRMGLYGISPFRFVFPEVKCIEWGAVHRNFAYLSSRFLFNGIGLTVSDCSPEQLLLLTRRAEAMRSVGDVLGSMDCEPLVPALVPGLLANRFTLGDREVYTLWNRSGKDVQGALLNVPGKPGRRFVELLSGRVCRTIRKGTGDAVELSLPDGEVALLGVFPKVLGSEGGGVTCPENMMIDVVDPATGKTLAAGGQKLEVPPLADGVNRRGVRALKDGYLVQDYLEVTAR